MDNQTLASKLVNDEEDAESAEAVLDWRPDAHAGTEGQVDSRGELSERGR